MFLAKFLGFYFLLSALLWLSRKRQIEAACKDVVASKGLLAVSGEISFIIGLAIAIDHPIWEYNWKGLITLIGYLLILKGILRFAFPNHVKKWVSKMMKGMGFWLTIIIMLAIGIYLIYCGFN